jgi:hypothetical protein
MSVDMEWKGGCLTGVSQREIITETECVVVAELDDEGIFKQQRREITKRPPFIDNDLISLAASAVNGKPCLTFCGPHTERVFLCPHFFAVVPLFSLLSSRD